MRCPSCSHDNRPDRRFCTACGVALSAFCPACGAATDTGEKFCGGCGERIPAATEAPGAPPPAPRPDAATASGERRQLTVLFCDLVGSTSLSQQLDPEEWRDLIAQYQQAAAGAVGRFGGHVAKNLGDGLLIYFGWPAAREDDPERAVRAGLAIIDAMVPLNATLTAETRLAVRVGLHTGPVVIADGGEVFGETANVSARVQGAAEPDTVMITAATQRLLSGMFVVEDRGAQHLKGVREPVTLYRVVRPSGIRGRLGVAAQRLTRFVGREIELATLVDRWERAQDGQGQNVIVVGEAGVGKSRLVYQLRERLLATPHTWLECGATPFTEGTPFHPVIALVAQGFGFAPSDTGAEKLAKLEGGLGALASPDTVALLADFVGLPPLTPLAMSPELRRHRTMDLLAQWAFALSSTQGLVLVVEDLHWCDASSLELLGHLIAQSSTMRVLLLATARSEFTPPWPLRSNVTTLQLARLTSRQARDMVAALGGNLLSGDTLDALVARADGVPLYVEELTKAMVDPGVPRGLEAIPATLADSLMARLDRLSTAKEVAQRAAVLGREFSYPLLAAAAGLEETGLRHGLALLVEAEILFGRGEPPAATYTFKHALVQEAAYASLLKRARQQLHGRVVEVLLATFPERAAAEPEVVARHADAAGRVDDAIAYYQRAGEHAQARSAHEEAIRLLRRAIALLAPQRETVALDAREVTLQLALGGSLIAARGFAHPEVEAAHERTRMLCDAVGDAAGLGLALIGLANIHHNRGEVERGRILAARVLTDAEQRGDTKLALLAHDAVSNAEFYQGKFASSLAHCEAAQALYRPAQHAALVSALGSDSGVSSRCYGAWSLWVLGLPDRALVGARDGVALGRQLGHQFSLAFALFFETVVNWLRRDMAAQRKRAAETITLSEAQGFPLFLGLGQAYHAAAYAEGGATDAVAGVLAGLALAAETGHQGAAPALFALLGETHMAAEQFAEARAAMETGLAVAEQTGQPFWDAELHRLEGEIALKTVDSRQSSVESRRPAEESFWRALDIARVQKAKSFELRAATSLARLWREEGKGSEARALLGPICAWFTEGFDTRDLQDAKALLAELG